MGEALGGRGPGNGNVRDPVNSESARHDARAFAWSPDGRFLVYEAVSDGSWDLWVTDAEGKNPRRPTSDPGNERRRRWSPDGKFLYYVKDFRSVWRLPMGADARPTGPAERWAEFPKTRIDATALAVSGDGSSSPSPKRRATCGWSSFRTGNAAGAERIKGGRRTRRPGVERLASRLATLSWRRGYLLSSRRRFLYPFRGEERTDERRGYRLPSKKTCIPLPCDSGKEFSHATQSRDALEGKVMVFVALATP